MSEQQPPLTPTEERERAIHRLSEMVTVVLLNAQVMAEELEKVRARRTSYPVRKHLDEVMSALKDVQAACAGAVELFATLRRVV